MNEYILFLYLGLGLCISSVVFLLIKINKKNEDISILEMNLKRLSEKASNGSEMEMGVKVNDLKAEKAKSEAEIQFLKERIDELSKSISANLSLEQINQQKESLLKELDNLKSEVDGIKDYQELKESGLYTFRFNFQSVEKYQDALDVIKLFQKKMVKDNAAFKCYSAGLDGTPIVKNLSRLSLQAFNYGADLVTTQVKYNNFESCEKRMIDLFERINNHLSSFNSCITEDYFQSKVKEMALALEYESEKQKIRQEQDEIKAQIREEQREIFELEKARDEAIQREKEIEKAIEKARSDILGKSESEKDKMLSIIRDLEARLADAHDNTVRAISNAQITSRGHVYIISNIGAFGEGIFKIGMTRRDDPNERVKELSDASVPFTFDVHGIIESSNARKLEADLHAYFDSKRINKINRRKEFFQVSIAEIEVACRELDVPISLTKLAEASEYRQSLKLKNDKVA